MSRQRGLVIRLSALFCVCAMKLCQCQKHFLVEICVNKQEVVFFFLFFFLVFFCTTLVSCISLRRCRYKRIIVVKPLFSS